MLRALLRSEIFRAFPVLLGVLTVNAGLCTMTFLSIAKSRQSEVPASWLVLLGWLSVALFLAVSPVRNRCRLLDLALPVSARRLRVFHLASVVVAASAIAAANVAVVALLGSLTAVRTRLEADIPHLALVLLSGILLATALLDSFRPSLARIPVTRSYVAWVVVVLVGTTVVLVALGRAGAVLALAPVIAAVAAGWSLLRVTPEAFVIVPAEPERERPGATPGPAAEGAAERPGPAGRVLARTLLRLLSFGAKDAATYPFVAVMGAAVGGGLGALLDDPDAEVLRLWNLPLSVYMLFSLWTVRLGSLHLVDPLPVRRRTMFALLALPSLLAFGLGYGAGALLAARADARRESVRFVETRAGQRFDVPSRFYRIARDGNPPEVGSPWGETFRPKARYASILWSRAALYNPFSVGPESSREFAALQIGRAAEAVYGVSIPPDEIAARYLESDAEGRVVPREGGLTLRKDYPGLAPRARGPASVLLLPLVAVPWLFLVSLLLRAYRPCVPERLRLWIAFGAMGALFLSVVGSAGAMIAGIVRPAVLDSLFGIAAAGIGASWALTAAAWLACATVVALAYRLAEGRFFRMEIPARPTAYTLIERMRERP